MSSLSRSSTPAGTRITERAHLVGVNGGPRPAAVAKARPKPELLRPLDEYAAVAGGSF